MIPDTGRIRIGQSIEIVKWPTRTYKIDFEGDRMAGHIDEREAMEQAIFKILQTQRYKYVIYNWNYGFEIADLFGKPKPYVYSELKRRIGEALLVDDRIHEVDNFRFESPSRDVVAVRFTACTKFGDIEAEGRVVI